MNCDKNGIRLKMIFFLVIKKKKKKIKLLVLFLNFHIVCKHFSE